MVRKIFLSKIFFTDLSNFKIRPILIIKEYKDEDFLYVPLTSNLKINGIELTTMNLESGQMYKPTIIAVPKIGIIHKSFLLKEIGLIKQEAFDKVLHELCNFLECFRIK